MNALSNLKVRFLLNRIKSQQYVSLLIFTCLTFSISLGTILGISLGMSLPAKAAITPLRIAVASNFFPVLEKIIPQFTEQTQIKTQIISSATGALFLQIKHGAPFDVFIAADTKRPQQLKQEQLLIPNSVHTYAYGQLALWSAFNESLTLTALANVLSQKRFAIANPKIAPYGKAAKEVLTHVNLWSMYKNKFIMGTNINQTFQQVRSKAVYAGIIANSQLRLNNLTGELIPETYYQPIEQQMGVLTRSKNVEAAKQFQQFLLSESVQQQLINYGYRSGITYPNSVNQIQSTKLNRAN